MRIRVVELLSRSLPRAVLYRAPADAEATVSRPVQPAMDFLCKAAGSDSGLAAETRTSLGPRKRFVTGYV
jgi:hypothetical protein